MVCLFFCGDHFIRKKCVYCIRLNIREIYYAGCGNEMEVEIWSVVVGTLLYLISLNDDSFQAVVLQHKDVPQRTAVLTGEQLTTVFSANVALFVGYQLNVGFPSHCNYFLI